MKATELHIKYRPTTFDDVYGNKSTVLAIRDALTNGRSRSFLLIGPPGTGKTTLARIIAGDLTYSEYDGALHTGVDDVRAIVQQARLRPLGSKARGNVLVIDECFARNTLVDTALGKRPIHTIEEGTLVRSHQGLRRVTHVFQTHVPLSRIVHVRLGDGSSLVCSSEHLFWAERGWVAAEHLTPQDVVFKVVRPEHAARLQEEDPTVGHLPALQAGVSRPSANSPEQVLFKAVRSRGCIIEAPWTTLTGRLRGNQGRHSAEPAEKAGLVAGSGPGTLCRHASVQSDAPCGGSEKGVSTAAGDRAQAVVPWRERDWSFPRRGSNAQSAGEKVAVGSCYPYGAHGGVSAHLQSGLRLAVQEVGGRGGRELTLRVGSEGAGQEEGSCTGSVRVESVSRFKYGSADQEFSDAVSAEDLARGSVVFFDLEVEEAHTYFAGGVLVHNCHYLSKNAWNALLKIVEEPPPGVVWVFCTSEGTKVPAAVRSRCQEYVLKPLPDELIEELVRTVAEREKIKVSDGIVELLVEAAAGIPRNALVGLGKVASSPADKEFARSVLSSIGGEESGEVIDLCRMMMAGETNFRRLAAKVLSLQGKISAEGVRNVVNAYFSKACTSQQWERAAAILTGFADPYPAGAGDSMSPVLVSLASFWDDSEA